MGVGVQFDPGFYDAYLKVPDEDVLFETSGWRVCSSLPDGQGMFVAYNGHYTIINYSAEAPWIDGEIEGRKLARGSLHLGQCETKKYELDVWYDYSGEKCYILNGNCKFIRDQNLTAIVKIYAA
jgi:hypothetical protein